MKPLGYESITLNGEMAARNIKNLARLHDRRYRPGIVGSGEAANKGWPGDWEGRTILALTLLAQTLKIKPAFLTEIVKDILAKCNERGYRGELLDQHKINEQQLAGHGWLLRGLVEYYRWKGDPAVLDAINKIVEGLYLPVAGHFAHYPTSRQERMITKGGAAGHLADQVQEWLLSTDIGCAFIALDGLTQAYELTRNQALGQLIDEMTDTFFRIDLLGITAQTHATLTASRGVMRMYSLTGRRELLDKSLAIYRLYKAEGMTENFANFNLFRELIWTEPCGIIDSFMLAMSLWEQTGDKAILEDAHEIWYNGVERGQRPNGGFGCDTCVDDGWVGIFEHFYEAYWCCSMRGGEGLGAPMRHSLYEDDATIVLPFYLDAVFNRACGANEVIRETSRYPEEGKIELEIMQGSGKRVEIKMFLPTWAKDPAVLINHEPHDFRVENGFAIFNTHLTTGTTIDLVFGVPFLSVPTQGNYHAGKNLVTIRHGLLVLGSEEEGPDLVDLHELPYLGDGKYAGPSLKLMPLNKSYLMEEADVRRKRYKILFHMQEKS